MDVVDLPIASLIIRPDARRLREAAIPELMESIREHGMLSPLRVRPKEDKWELRQGGIVTRRRVGLNSKRCHAPLWPTTIYMLNS